MPLLLIDDEADNASINTKDKAAVGGGNEVTAINGKIRKLLDSFEKSAYVGYTATPFANIFINPTAETPEHGDDLFPRSFIINVKPPSNYVGPTKVFGLDGDTDAGILAEDGLDIVREIEDFAAPSMFPPKHKKDHVPAELPASLRQAIRCFILACAARRARGQDKKHNSMLVHVTRFVDVQNHVVRLVRDEVLGLQRRIEFGDGSRTPALREELRQLWETEFAPVSDRMGDAAGAKLHWAEVDAELHAAASKMVILPINGFAKEALDYREYEAEGRNVIAIGGDKLSRGLTLEGLSISYFLRTSRMYDTLMQMGRWFGYRPGYLDLCRLFTTGLLSGWYRHIALADAELRREFDYMVAAGLTPEQYGLRVRTHPGGMTITALNKMCHSQRRELRWSGVLVQTIQLPNDQKRLQGNLDEAAKFVGGLGTPSVGVAMSTRVWRNVSAKSVSAFVESLRYPPESARASGQQLGAFIRQQAAKNDPELVSWTVALVSVQDGAKSGNIGGQDVGFAKRTPERKALGGFSLKKANILNPADEAIDLRDVVFDESWMNAIAGKPELAGDVLWLWEQVGDDAEGVARDLTERWQNSNPPKLRSKGATATARANGRVVRVMRKRSNGLLLIYPLEPLVEAGVDPAGPAVIGVALSFPTSESVVGVEYRVNRVWGAEIEEDDLYDNDN